MHPKLSFAVRVECALLQPPTFKMKARLPLSHLFRLDSLLKPPCSYFPSKTLPHVPSQLLNPLWARVRGCKIWVNKVLSENINKYPAISGNLHSISYQALENTCGFTQKGQYPMNTSKIIDKTEFLVWNAAKQEIPYSVTYIGIRGKNYFCVPGLLWFFVFLI